MAALTLQVNDDVRALKRERILDRIDAKLNSYAALIGRGRRPSHSGRVSFRSMTIVPLTLEPLRSAARSMPALAQLASKAAHAQKDIFHYRHLGEGESSGLNP